MATENCPLRFVNKSAENRWIRSIFLFVSISFEWFLKRTTHKWIHHKYAWSNPIFVPSRMSVIINIGWVMRLNLFYAIIFAPNVYICILWMSWLCWSVVTRKWHTHIHFVSKYHTIFLTENSPEFFLLLFLSWVYNKEFFGGFGDRI